MIISTGEILVDRIIKEDGAASYVGGAPYNVAVNAFESGAKTAFFGKIGEDADGRYVVSEAKRRLPDGLYLSVADGRPTTVALVTLTKGERSFKFLRAGTADYMLCEDDINFEFEGLNIVHLGTLMLNTEEGLRYARYVADRCAEHKVRLSVDANFRDDLFFDKAERNAVFAPFLKRADILKLSEEELAEFTGEKSVEAGIKALSPKEYAFITCGAKGSYAYKKGVGLQFVPATPAEKIVDTTGAGDAYYGKALACLDEYFSAEKSPTAAELAEIAKKSNEAGKAATQREGAV